jgi:transketolase
MLLYALLHLSGVRRVEHGRVTDELAISLDDIRRFRQIDSVTPGHPERGLTTGVEATTGPLGQGCGNSVGMAMASRWLAARYNRSNLVLFDYDVYAICSDGDMMEGVASESASLAGHLGLSNLCWIYDSNTVTIEGHTDLAFSEDVERRFQAYRWNVLRVGDANDRPHIVETLETFRRTGDRPTLIIVDSIIGYGAPHKQNTAAAHSDALGTEEVRLAKRFYGWPEDAQFLVPDGVYDRFRSGIGRRGQALRVAWETAFGAYRREYPETADEIAQLLSGDLPKDHARGLRKSAQRHRSTCALAHRRRRRSRAVDQDQALVRRSRHARSRRPQPAFRGPRARHGSRRERPRAFANACLWRDLPDLQRLHADADPARRTDETAGLPRLYP